MPLLNTLGFAAGFILLGSVFTCCVCMDFGPGLLRDCTARIRKRVGKLMGRKDDDVLTAKLVYPMDSDLKEAGQKSKIYWEQRPQPLDMVVAFSNEDNFFQ